MENKNNEPRKGSNEPAKVQIVDMNPFDGTPISGDKLTSHFTVSHQEPVPGLLPVGLTLLMGPSKSGLTTISSHLVGKTSNGQPVFDRYMTKVQRVAYQSLTQDTIRAKKMITDLSNELGAYLSNILLIPGEKEIGMGHTVRAQEYIQRQKLKVLFIDPIIGAMGMKIAGSFQKSYKYLNDLSNVAHQTGAAIVAVYHSTTRELDENIFASKSLAAAADNILLLTNRYENENVTYYSLQHYGRMFPKRNIYLKSEGSRYNLREIDELPKWEIDPDMKSKLTILRSHDVKQVDMAQVLGISQGQVSKMLQELGPLDQGEEGVYVDDIGYFEPEDSDEFEDSEDETDNTESSEEEEQSEPEK